MAQHMLSHPPNQTRLRLPTSDTQCFGIVLQAVCIPLAQLVPQNCLQNDLCLRRFAGTAASTVQLTHVSLGPA